MSQKPENRLKRGRLVWLLWFGIVVVLLFAFLFGAFNLCSPT